MLAIIRTSPPHSLAAHYIETVPNAGYRLVAPVYGCTTNPVVLHKPVDETQIVGFGGHIYALLKEFRERKVCRSMVIYMMVVWLIFQVSEIMVPALSLPDWVNTLVVVLGLLGFPVAATLSWIFNLTPSGLVRETVKEASSEPVRARKWTELAIDSALISIGLVICVMLVFTSFV